MATCWPSTWRMCTSDNKGIIGLDHDLLPIPHKYIIKISNDFITNKTQGITYLIEFHHNSDISIRKMSLSLPTTESPQIGSKVTNDNND